MHIIKVASIFAQKMLRAKAPHMFSDKNDSFLFFFGIGYDSNLKVSSLCCPGYQLD